MKKSMRIIIETDGEILTTTLGSFLEHNRESFDEAEVSDIMAALGQNRSYHGGGGAFAWWIIRLDSAQYELEELDIPKPLADFFSICIK